MKDNGYVLLGVVIIIVILGIFMGAAVPIWQHVMKREREEELIWRGKQYVQAIELYQKKHPGAYPPNLDILVKQKFLRKLYKDPMAEDGEWKILRQLSPEIRTRLRGPARGRGSGGSRPGSSQGERGGEQASPTRPRRSSFGRGGEQGLGGIVGVASKSEEESIRVFEDKTQYNEWLFVYVAQARGTQRPGASPTPQRPGAPSPRRPGEPPRPGAPQRRPPPR